MAGLGFHVETLPVEQPVAPDNHFHSLHQQYSSENDFLAAHAEDTLPNLDSEDSEDLDSKGAEAQEGVEDEDEDAAEAGARVKEETPLHRLPHLGPSSNPDLLLVSDPPMYTHADMYVQPPKFPQGDEWYAMFSRGHARAVYTWRVSAITRLASTSLTQRPVLTPFQLKLIPQPMQPDHVTTVGIQASFPGVAPSIHQLGYSKRMQVNNGACVTTSYNLLLCDAVPAFTLRVFSCFLQVRVLRAAASCAPARRASSCHLSVGHGTAIAMTRLECSTYRKFPSQTFGWCATSSRTRRGRSRRRLRTTRLSPAILVQPTSTTNVHNRLFIGPNGIKTARYSLGTCSGTKATRSKRSTS